MNRNCQGHLESTQSRRDEGPYLSVEAFIVSVITPAATAAGRVSFNVFATYCAPQSDGGNQGGPRFLRTAARSSSSAYTYNRHHKHTQGHTGSPHRARTGLLNL